MSGKMWQGARLSANVPELGYFWPGGSAILGHRGSGVREILTVDFGWPAGRLIFRRGNFGGGSKLGKIVGLDLALAFENSIKGGVFWDYGVIFVWTGEHH